ncbi:MAG: hypothetical protein QM752_05120 [Gammaproteobacteria bacterium]
MEEADTMNKAMHVKRSIDMFFGRCKKANEALMSVEAMDEVIMQAVSENNGAVDI